MMTVYGPTPTHEKAAPGANWYGLKSISNEAYSVNRLGNPARYPEQRANWVKQWFTGRQIVSQPRPKCARSRLSSVRSTSSWYPVFSNPEVSTMTTTTRRPRRCRCQYCDSLYLPTEESGLYGVCGRCASLWIRLHQIYPDRAVDVDAKIRAILADPLGPEVREALDLEGFLKLWCEADGYGRAMIKQSVARLKKAAMREKFSVIQGGREQ